jgi:uncharacterized membrane protein required for colicin V production
MMVDLFIFIILASGMLIGVGLVTGIVGFIFSIWGKNG